MSAEVEGVQRDLSQVAFRDDEAVVNGNEFFSKESSENRPVKETRIIRKAKRHLKTSPRKEERIPDETANTILNGASSNLSTNGNAVKASSSSKNSRKSRDNRGRGLPKKGGAGGKGTWGAPGSEGLDANECTKDSHDPNYDSDSQDNVVVRSITPEIMGEDVDKVVLPILQEYFEHGDTNEVVDSLRELTIRSEKHRIPGLAVSLAMDHKATHRELTSRLISGLYGSTLSREEIGKSFDSLMNDLNDLTLDTPEAPHILGQFIARAIADDCLPPKFISSYKGNLKCPFALQALEKADILLSLKHGIVRLDNVWGVGGGIRPVKYLTKKIILLLKEYLSSGDVKEATQCLQELEVPHFHHELVYEASVIVIEDCSERASALMVKLLLSLSRACIITPEQMDQGFQRVCDNMPDICLDVPAAYTLLDRFANKCHDAGVMSDKMYKELPAKGRKRFVSEGDGGKIKE